MATFIRKLFGHFGAMKDHAQRKPIVVPEEGGRVGVKVAVAAEKTINVPLVSRRPNGTGGVQGLNWYIKNLQVDDDGDVAQEFLSEVCSDCLDTHLQGRLPRLVCVAPTKPAILKGPICTHDGNVHQDVEPSHQLVVSS